MVQDWEGRRPGPHTATARPKLAALQVTPRGNLPAQILRLLNAEEIGGVSGLGMSASASAADCQLVAVDDHPRRASPQSQPLRHPADQLSFGKVKACG